MNDLKIVEVYETTDYKEVNNYLKQLGWIFLMAGTRYNSETKSLTIYYSIGRPENISTERW